MNISKLFSSQLIKRSTGAVQKSQFGSRAAQQVKGKGVEVLFGGAAIASSACVGAVGMNRMVEHAHNNPDAQSVARLY